MNFKGASLFVYLLIKIDFPIMKFTASLDGLAKGITLGVNLFFLSIAAFPYLFFQPAERGEEAILIPIFLFLIELGVFIFRPISYTITDQEITINRLWKSVIINRKDVQTVEILDKDFFKRTIRTFGVGGMWGYFGKFIHDIAGTMSWYVTRRDSMILLILSDDKKVVLSPDDLEGFVNKFEIKPIKSLLEI